MTDDFDRADTPVVGTPCRNDCPLAKRAVKAHWLNLLSPDGSIAKLAAMVDGMATRLAMLDARLRLVAVVVAALAGMALGFAAGWATVTCARLL